MNITLNIYLINYRSRLAPALFKIKTSKIMKQHLSQVFSQTDNTITYGQLYIAILIIIALFGIAGYFAKRNSY